MNRPKVVIIAMDQPLDNDAQFRRRLKDVENWAERQSSRYPGLDFPAIQKGVNHNRMKLPLALHGRYMDLCDLMNFVRHDHHLPTLTPENVSRYYSLANTITLNGIYLYQYLRGQGYDPIIIQNYATADLNAVLQEQPLAVCISSNFMYMDNIQEIALRVKTIAPEVHVIAGGMLVKRLLDPGEKLSGEAFKSFSAFSGKVDAFVVDALRKPSPPVFIEGLTIRVND